MSNKDFSDFLLTEYENIAAAFFNSREVLAKWVRYYLLVMAAPFSLIAFIYKDVPEKFNIFALPVTLLILIAITGIIGLLLSFVIIQSGIDTVLYARTVNGIRKYFVDDSGINSIKPYLVLPIDTSKPAYFKYDDLFFISILTGIINSSYIGISITQLVNTSHKLLFTVIIFFILLITHPFFYRWASNIKDKEYGNTV